MTQVTIQNTALLLREIASLPEPERTEYVKMMRNSLMGVRLALSVNECNRLTAPPLAGRPSA